MMIRVKICGITNAEDARTAVEFGADALGFIFVENTPRFVTPEQVAPIIQRLPPFVTPVGVFWDHPSGHVKAVAEACGLRALQFHGDETREDVAGYDLPVKKTAKMARASTIGGLPVYRIGDAQRVISTARSVPPCSWTPRRGGARARRASPSSGGRSGSFKAASVVASV